MKRAKVIHRRTLADGRMMVNVACPVCDRRHWLPRTEVGHCPRRCRRFTIPSEKTAKGPGPGGAR